MTAGRSNLRGGVRRFLPAWRQYMMIVGALSDDPKTVDELAMAAKLTSDHVQAVLPKMLERREVESFFLGGGKWGWSLTAKGEEIRHKINEHGPTGLPAWVQPKVSELGDKTMPHRPKPTTTSASDPIEDFRANVKRQLKERGIPIRSLSEAGLVDLQIPGGLLKAFLNAKRP